MRCSASCWDDTPTCLSHTLMRLNTFIYFWAVSLFMKTAIRKVQGQGPTFSMGYFGCTCVPLEVTIGPLLHKQPPPVMCTTTTMAPNTLDIITSVIFQTYSYLSVPILLAFAFTKKSAWLSLAGIVSTILITCTWSTPMYTTYLYNSFSGLQSGLCYSGSKVGVCVLCL